MIELEQFEAVDMRVGRVVEVCGFPEARKPAWKRVVLLRPDRDAAPGDRIG